MGMQMFPKDFFGAFSSENWIFKAFAISYTCALNENLKKNLFYFIKIWYSGRRSGYVNIIFMLLQVEGIEEDKKEKESAWYERMAESKDHWWTWCTDHMNNISRAIMKQTTFRRNMCLYDYFSTVYSFWVHNYNL